MSEHLEMLAGDVMSVPVVSVPPSTRLDKLADVMRDHSISSLAVADAALRPLGIVTKADLVRHSDDTQDRAGLTAGDIMTCGLRTVDPDTPINAIVEMFDGLGIRCVLVVSQHRLVGIVTQEDLRRESIRQANRQTSPQSDDALRASVFEALSRVEPSLSQLPDFSIDNGVVHFWGETPPSDAEVEAVLRVVRARQS